MFGHWFPLLWAAFVAMRESRRWLSSTFWRKQFIHYASQLLQDVMPKAKYFGKDGLLRALHSQHNAFQSLKMATKMYCSIRVNLRFSPQGSRGPGHRGPLTQQKLVAAIGNVRRRTQALVILNLTAVWVGFIDLNLLEDQKAFPTPKLALASSNCR